MTLAKISIEPRKHPRQTRSWATVDAVVEATTYILEEHGLAALNTNEIARRAGISIGSLYQYFPTKEAILTEIIRRKQRRLLESFTHTLESLQNQPFELIVRSLIDVAITQQPDKPKFARALNYAYAVFPLQTEAETLNKKIVTAIVKILPDNFTGEPVEAAYDIVVIVRSMLDAENMRGEINRHALANRIYRVVQGYLYNESITY